MITEDFKDKKEYCSKCGASIAIICKCEIENFRENEELSKEE